MRRISQWVLLLYFIGTTIPHSALGNIRECHFRSASEQQEHRMDLRTFDINDFNKNRHGSERFFTHTNGVTVMQLENPSTGYVEKIYQPDSPYACLYFYNKKGQLIRTVNRFYDGGIGILTEYDGKGNITKQTDFDKDYPFSITQVAEKMKREFNVDILDIAQIKRFERFVDEVRTQRPYYEIIVYADASKMRFKGYIVDGVTGDLLFFTDKFPLPISRGAVPNLYLMYLQSLGQKKHP